MIWGSLLWDLRGELGAAVSDRLAAWAMGEGDASVETFAMASLRLLQADKELFGGAHQAPIQVALSARGLATATTVAATEVPWARGMTAYPLPASGSLTIRLTGLLEGSVVIRAFDLSGRFVEEFQSDGSSEVHWDVSGLPPGLYFLQGVSEASAFQQAASPSIRVIPVVVAR
jgi:hypothetical protein